MYAQLDDPTVVEIRTVNVFPGEVVGDGWNNLETITFQNLEPYSLYQEFNSVNSASPRASVGWRLQKDKQKTSDTATVEDTSVLTATPSTTIDVTDATTTKVQSTGSTTEEVLEDVTVVDTETNTTSTPEVKPSDNEEDLEPQTDEQASSSPVVIKQIDTIFSFVFAKITQALPFTQSSTTTVPEETTETVVAETTEPELVPTSTPTTSTVDEDEPDEVTVIASTTEEIAEDTSSTTENVTQPSQDENIPAQVKSSTSAIIDDEVVEDVPCGDNCVPYVITLSDFGVPIFESGTELSGAQLRMSFAAKRKATRDEVQSLQVLYSFDDGTTWDNSGAVVIDDEASNSINGGYYLFPLPQINDEVTLNQLSIQVVYEEDPAELEHLFIESVWLELFVAEIPDASELTAMELQADDNFFEGILNGDELVIDGEDTITFENTDENEGETLIIKSDKKSYAGLSKTTTYFNVTNTANSDDTFSIQTYFPEAAGEVLSLQQWQPNKPRQIVVPEYRPFMYHCEAGWEYSGEPVTTSLEDISKLFAPKIEQEDSTASSSLETATTSQSTKDEPETDEQSVEKVSSSTEEIMPEPDDENIASTTASGFPLLDNAMTWVQATFLNEDKTEATTSQNSITQSTASSTQAFSDETASYVCRDTNIVRACDSLEGDNTLCRMEDVKVREHNLTRYKGGWVDTDTTTGKLPEPGLFKKVKQFFGFAADEKFVPDAFVPKTYTQDTYTIKPGETKYFKMEIEFPPLSKGEFWIEAIGDSEYGLLDPFWNSQWQYRMPITLDNTTGAVDLIEHQVFLELDNSISDFWSNVNNDGSDIRFVYESPGNTEEDWYGLRQPDNNWYDLNWDARMPIIIQSSQIDTALTDFPVYVNLANLGSEFFNAVQTDGDDIRITTSDGQSEVPYELVSIDTGSNTGELYFQADSLSSSADTTFYIYYDNSSVSGYGPTATYGSQNVWSNGYEAVYHFDEDPSGSSPQYADSTGNSSGSATNMEGVDQVAGLAGGNAADLDGVDERIETTFSQSLLASTWSVILSADGTQGGCDGLMFSRGGQTSGINLAACGDTGEIGYHWNDAAATYNWVGGPTYPTNEWFMASMVVEPSQMTMYAHTAGGVSSGSNVVAHASSDINNLDFGWDSFGTARSFDGQIDEARLSSVARNVDWLDAEFRNASNTLAFYATSSSEAPPELITIGEWSYRVPITIQSSAIDAPLTDFPVYVDLADLGTTFFEHVQINGNDIRVTTADGLTEVPYDVVAIDTGSETGELHFKAPSLSDTVDTTFYVYFGNHDAPGYVASDEFGAENVWNSSFIATYHLEEDATGAGNGGLYTDSTVNGYDADDEITSTGKTGKLGLGQEIRARESTSDDYILFPSDVVNGENQFVTSFWLDTSQNSNQALLNAGANNEIIVFLQNTQLILYDGGATDTFTLDTDVTGTGWNHFVVIRDASNSQWRLYINGVADNQNPLTEAMSALAIPADCFMMGLEQDTTCLNSGDAGQHLDGLVDEVRFRNTLPSDAEISAEYDNQNNTASFYTVDTLEPLEPTTFTELDFWVQHFSTTTEEADIWVQVNSLPAGATTTIYLYYGNSAASSASDQYAPFTYSTLTPLYYALDDDATGPIEIYSYIDNNEVSIDGNPTVSLDAGETTSFATYSGASVISTLGPIAGTIDNADSDTIAPISFASTTLLVATNRNTNEYFVRSPIVDSTVNSYIGNSGTPDETNAVSSTTIVRFTSDPGGGNALVFESNNPILAFHQAVASQEDAFVAYPPTTRDLFGIDSNTTYISSITANPDPTVYCSDSTTATVSGITRGELQAVNNCTQGNEGTGNAVRFTGANYSISAVQQADSDGGEATAYWPQHEFAEEYYFATDAAYAAVACSPRFGTVDLEVQTNTGVLVESNTCTPSGTLPGKAYFVNGQDGDALAFPAGYKIVSTNNVPFYVIYEEDNEETNILSAVQARKFTQTPIGASFGAQEVTIDAEYEQLSFGWYENVNVQTPTSSWPIGDSDTVDEGEPIVDEGSVSVGDILRLRMNLEVSTATGTVGSTAFKLQYAEAETCSLAESWFDTGDIGSTTAAFSGYNNSAVTDGSIIGTTTLAGSTVGGSYEEENLSSFIQTKIEVGEVAEWDWVIENTNANTNATYCFRMVRSGGQALGTYTTYPTLETSGPPDSPTLSVYFDNEKTATTTPVLEFIAIDSSNDDIHYQVQVDDDRDFSSTIINRNSISHFSQFENINTPSDKAPFFSGAPIRFTSITSLTPTTTYWWRVRARDPEGTDTWGDWSNPDSFTLDGSVTLSQWHQTTGHQFTTNTLTGVSTSSGAVSVSGSSGDVTSSAIDFDDATSGNAWGEFSWNDTETSGTILYQVEYYTGSSWTLVPDNAISGNSVGNGTSPISLLSLNTDTYNQIRLKANFLGTTLSLNDWTVSWGERVSTPELGDPFDNQKVGTTTPTFTFTATDPDSYDLEYQLSYSTDDTFTSSTTVTTTTFSSGSDGNYTIPGVSSLTNTETYWWRVRARAPAGANAWSPWSNADAFTVDTAVTVSTWFQTTKEQFNQNTLSGVTGSDADAAVINSYVGEYGTTSLNNNDWTEITTQLSYSDMVVVASAEYNPVSLGDGRTVRIRGKTSNTFEIKVDDETDSYSGTTLVDYIVMEAGTWTIEDGATGIQVTAATEEAVSGTQNQPYANDVGSDVTFSPTFTGSPAVLASISSNIDSAWVGVHVDDGSTNNGDVTGTTMGIALGMSRSGFSHGPEDVDYIVFDSPNSGTNDGVPFQILNTTASVVDGPNNGGYTQSLSGFSVAPAVTVVQQNAANGADGSFALKDLSGTQDATNMHVSVIEMGASANAHTGAEVSSVVAFEDETGFIARDQSGGDLVGTMYGEPIVFSDGAGPKFEQAYWNHATPSASTIVYQIEYLNGETWALIPNGDLPGNSTGYSVGPLDLSNLDVGTYSTIRLVATLECDGSNCPSIQDWTVEWSEGVTMSGTLQEYDRSINVASGTIAVAVNGTLLGSTGSVSNGVWSVNNVTAFAGDVVTAFVNGADDDAEAVGVFIYDGSGDMTDVALYERHLSFDANEKGTTTNALLATYDNSVSGDEDIFFDVDGANDLTVCATTGCNRNNLYIGSGNVYIPDVTNSGNVATYDLINDGYFAPNGNTVRVGGSWENNDTFLPGTSSVIFTATTTAFIAPAWYNATWQYRIPITIDATEIDDDLTDFPVYVDLADLGSHFFANLNTDGGDIRVTNSGATTELEREVVSASTTAQTGELYFLADTISSTTDTTFYIYYGNGAASDYATNDTYGAENVWSNGYLAVYHFDEDPSGGSPQYSDSTGSYTGTAQNMEAGDRISAVAGYGVTIDGANEYIDTTINEVVLDSTWSIWLNANGTQGGCDGVMFSRGTGVNGINVGSCGDTSRIGHHWENLGATSWNFTGGPLYPTNEWFMAAMVVQSSGSTMYALTDSGVTSGTNANTHTASTIDALDFGQDPAGGRLFNGSMDEARLADTTRSQAWLKAEFENLSDSNNFYTATSFQTATSAGTTLLATLDDADGTLDFYDITFGETSGDALWDVLDPLDIGDDLVVAYGTLDRNTHNIYIVDDLITGANGFWTGSATTTFDGSGGGLWTDNNATKQNIGNVLVDGSGKTITLGGSVRAQTLTIGANDALNAGGAHTLTLSGNFTNNNTFTPQTGTIEIVGAGTNALITTGGSSLYSLTASTTGGGAVSFTESSVTLLGNFTIATGTVTLPNTLFSVGGSFNNTGGNFAHNNAEVRFTGTGSETITLNGNAFFNNFYDVRFTGNSAWTFLDTNATTSNNFIITAGTVTLPSGQLAVDRDFTVSGSGAFAHNNGEVLLLIHTDDTVTTNGSSFNNVRVRESDPIREGDYDEAWLYRNAVTINASEIDDDVTDFPVYLDLADFDANFFNNINTDGGDIRITLSDGVTEVPREIVSASTTAQTGEVYFLAPTLSSTTDSVFYVYYGNGGASDYAIDDTYGAENVWVNDFLAVYHMNELAPVDSTQFDKDTVVVGNTPSLSASGRFGNAISIIDDGSADYLDLQDNLNELEGLSGMTISAWANVIDDTNDDVIFTRGGAGTAELLWDNWGGTTNNDTWTFNVDSTGSGNNRVDAAPTGISVGDTWQYVTGVMEGGARHIYVDGALANTNTGGVATIRTNSGGTFIGYWSGSTAFDYSGLLDEYRISTSTRSAAWIAAEFKNMSTSTDFYTVTSGAGNSSRIFAGSNATILGNLILESGQTQFPSLNLNIGGSFDNDGIFIAGSGAVNFTSTADAETIAAGVSDFYTLTFNGAGGDFTVTESATATNAINLTQADIVTINTGLVLESTGTFTNNLSNASTTWTGATLRLSSGNDITINSKTHAGDTYNILSVTDTGIVRMWNSTATTYDTQDTSSIYSQDHAGNDGDLYIFGDYVRGTGTEYWSYATDFDGTALDGGSRQVDVRVANGASVTASSSVLHIVGNSSASTTIDAQSGSFSLTANKATVTAQYITVTGTDASGLQLLGSTTMAQFTNASFAIPVASVAITVDASTIDTNPAAQFFATEFITAGGNVNVDLSGTPSSYWWFREGAGDRYGEAYDNDALDPGPIRWDDSNYLIDISGTIYADDGSSPLGGPTCDGGTDAVTVVVNGGSYTDTVPCNGVNGSYSFTNVAYNGDATIVVYLDDTAGGEVGSTVTRTPTTDITNYDIYANRVMVRHEDVTPMNSARMALYDESDDVDLRFVAATGTLENTLTVRPNNEFYVFATSTFTPNGPVTLQSGGTGTVYDGSLHLGSGATFVGVGTTTYTVGGSIILESDATLTTASSTFNLTATTTGKTITSSDTIEFNELTFIGSGGGWNINSDIIAYADIVVTNGTVTGTGDITLTNGSFYGNGLVSLGGGTTAINQSNTLGGTQGWTFNNLTLGTGSVVGTTTPGSTATTTVGGVLTISAAHFLDAGSSVWNLTGTGNVFVENGTFLEDTSTVVYGGSGNANVLSTTYYNLTANAEGSSPTFTAQSLGFQVLSNLQVGGSGTTTLTFTTNDPIVSVDGDVHIADDGTFIASNSNTLSVAGSWDNDGTFVSSSGLVDFVSDDAFSIEAGASNFGNILVSGAGTATVSEHATSTGYWTLAVGSDFTVTPGQRLAIGSAFNNNAAGSATTWTGSTLHLFGAGQFQINTSTTQDEYATLSAGTGTHIRMWNSSSTVYTTASGGSIYSMDHADVAGDLYIFGDYTRTSGIDYWSYATDFDGTALGGGREVDVYVENGGNFTYNGGSLQLIGSSSAPTAVQVQGAGTYTANIAGGAINAQHYVLQDMDSDGLTFTGTPTVTTLSNGTFIVGSDNARGMTIAGSVIDANPAKNFVNNVFATTTGVTTAVNASTTGSTVSSWRFTTHSGDIDGEAFDADNGDPGYLVWDNSTPEITITGRVYESDGSTPSSVCGASTNIVLAVDGVVTQAASSSCNGSGLYSISGVSFSPNDTLTLFIDGEADQGATISIDPISSVGNMDIYEDHVIVRHESAEPILIADLADYDSSNDGDIPFTAVDAGTDTLALDPDFKLLVWNGKEFAPQGNITTGSGSGDALDGTIELRANATVTLGDGQTHSFGGNLEAGSNATFVPAQSSITFTSSGSGRIIDTNNAGFYDVTINSTGSYISSDTQLLIGNDLVLDNGALILPSATTSISGSLTTTGGSFDANGGVIYFDASTAQTISAAGSEFNKIIFNGSGSWSMDDTNATATADVLIQSGAVSLPSNTFALDGNFQNTGGAITHNTSHVIMSTTSNASLRVSGSDLYAITFTGGGNFSMEDNSLSFLDDVLLANGSLTLASGTVSIGGSFDATGGTFDHATGTILFNASAIGKTVNAGGNDFYNVQFGSASGGWTLEGGATTTNNFTLAAADDFTLQSGTTLRINGVFTNLVGGLDTTWTGTTLYLDSGSTYTTNTKSQGGDTYNNVYIGSNTDISSWDSSGTVTLDASASFYSQDHAGIGGDLYIYGDYHVATGTRYWSYATDFDGAPLGGSSRQVRVYIQGGATTTVDGGSLHIVGVPSATTTIQNQGAGTYAFAVSGGIYNANYYSYQDLNVSGLTFSGIPTISSLSYGDFELAVGGGSLITLSSTTQSANPSKFVDYVRFATTTAITGVNVNLSATTSNAWRFRYHTGNLDGEAYDIDGVTDCGSIRWDDSSCLLVEQTHYRWRNDDGGLGAPDSEWFDNAWGKRQRVRVVNQDTSAYATTAVKAVVTYDANMQADFDDLRFTASDGVTAIPHWIETYTPSTEAVVWIQIPSLTSSGAYDSFMYYENGSATTTSSNQLVFEASDDFEDNNITEYTGNTSKFQTSAANAYGGAYGLEPVVDTDFTNDGIAHVSQTVSQGQIIRYMQYVDAGASGANDESCMLFGVQGSVTNNQNYAVCIELFLTDRLSLVRNAERSDNHGSVVMLASTTVTYSTGWYEVEVDWQTNDTIDVSLYTEAGALVATTSATDSNYTTGSYGFTYWGQHGTWDSFTARNRTNSQPSVYFGGEQIDGGATWNAALDTSSSNFEIGETARLRFAIENSGLAITDQEFLLEFAPIGAAPSCESVATGAYVAVPPSASCGSSAMCMATSTQFADGDAIADLLTDTEGTFITGEATEDPSNTADSLDIDQNEYTELEYAVSATINASDDAYCLRVTDAEDDLDAYGSVAEFALQYPPSMGSVSFNGGQNISLVGGTTTRVYATTSVTDYNGYADLSLGTTTMFTNLSGAACTADNNDCYISNTDTTCSFTNCSGNSCTLQCYADFFYHADPTDLSGGDWYAFMEVSDQQGGIDFATSPAIDLMTLNSLSVEDVISYGALAVASSTGTYNPTSTIQNIGNNAIDINVEGSDLTDGSSSIIPASQQRFATSSFDYASCISCTTLTTSTIPSYELDLSKPTDIAPPVEDVIYWGIAIPFGVASKPHTGINTFYAVSD